MTKPKDKAPSPVVTYEKRKIADLVPDAANPRVISDGAKKALATSIKRFGLVQPIIVNAKTGRIVGGHQRLDAMRAAGETEVDVAVGNWTDEEERVLNVALNNPEAQGEFNGDVRSYLTNSLRSLSIDDFVGLRLDALVLDPAAKKRTPRGGAKAAGLTYKLMVTCADEEAQATLCEELEGRGLTVKLLIV